MRVFRRILAGTFAFLVAAALLFVYARWVEPVRLTVKSFTVETESEIEPFCVVFFTDTHFGKDYEVSRLEKIVEEINRQDADVVLFGGDLLDHYARDRETLDLEALRRGLAAIEANVGKFAVFGNHDYGGGAVRIYEDLMKDGGFTVLDDESVVLEEYGVQLVGYDDRLMGWTDPALYTLKRECFQLIVAHEPVVAEEIRSESEGFLLSGHTHGGQVYLPILTEKLLPPGSGRFRKGLYSAEEIGTGVSIRMYTSSGIGTTKYPVRLFNVPEIVRVDFVCGEA